MKWLLLAVLSQICSGWTPSRRGFFAGSGGVATTIATVLVVPPAHAAPTASSLVDPASLTGQVMVVTGGTTGLGLESAKDLAKGGATVVLTARTESKGQTAIATIKDALKQEGIDNPNVYYVTLDLDKLENVASFVDRFKKVVPESKIDVVLNNAGVMAIPDRQLTSDGYERTFQSNHLGHFVLTAKLFPLLKDNARVINVSSLGYNLSGGRLSLDNLNSEKSYGPWKSYGYSKLENILFTQELQRRADAAGKPLKAVSLHPGAVNTDLARNMFGEQKWEERKTTGPTNAWEAFLNKAISSALLSIDEGAATQVYLASTSAANLVKGAFYNNLKPEKLPGFAKNEDDAKQLWEQSEKLTGVKFNIQ